MPTSRPTPPLRPAPAPLGRTVTAVLTVGLAGLAACADPTTAPRRTMSASAAPSTQAAPQGRYLYSLVAEGLNVSLYAEDIRFSRHGNAFWRLATRGSPAAGRPQAMPQPLEPGEIVITGALTTNMAVGEWRELVVLGKIEEARVPVTITVYDLETYAPVQFIRLRNVWPVAVGGPVLDQASGDFRWGEIVLAHEGLESP